MTGTSRTIQPNTWKQSVTEIRAGLPCYPATLRVAPSLLARLRRRRNPLIEHEGQPEGDGWVRLSVVSEVEGEACDFILRSVPQVEAVAPAALRTRVREAA